MNKSNTPLVEPTSFLQLKLRENRSGKIRAKSSVNAAQRDLLKLFRTVLKSLPYDPSRDESAQTIQNLLGAMTVAMSSNASGTTKEPAEGQLTDVCLDEMLVKAECVHFLLDKILNTSDDGLSQARLRVVSRYIVQYVEHEKEIFDALEVISGSTIDQLGDRLFDRAHQISVLRTATAPKGTADGASDHK